MSDIQFLLGFETIDRNTLTEEQRKNIINNIGVLIEFSSSASSAAADGIASDVHAQSLSSAASLLADIAGELNGLIQQ